MNVTRENEQFKKRARAVKYNPRSLRRSDKRGQQQDLSHIFCSKSHL